MHSKEAPEVRAWVIKTASPLSADAHGSVELAAAEMFANAVRHSRGGLATVRVRRLVQSVWLSVTDPGTDGALTAPMPCLPPPDADRGRGLYLLAAVSRRWGLSIGDRRTYAWCEITANRPSGPSSPSALP
ncbi:ATP-binding protein [Nocardiopsis mangrovi]|uniref:ATP-binding protein n=1 Tax=Nocardiopsis mangrovi TaxID=1179818 RepID=A0ABV9E2U2_9ACTN